MPAKHEANASANSVSPLKSLRLASGFSALEFARILDVDAALLYQVEKGSRPIPRRALSALTKMGCDADDIRAKQIAWGRDQADRLQCSAGETIRAAAEAMASR